MADVGAGRPLRAVGGISHNEIEDAKPADLTAGRNVLLDAVLDRANAVSDGADQELIRA
jgi:hypothetical protein